MNLDVATLNKFLSEAQIAYHRLALGEMVATTSNIDGGSVTYNQVSMPKLKAYIVDLEGQISRTTGGVRRKPIEFIPDAR